MQLQAANVQGKNMILRTLAQYSALMVMKKIFQRKNRAAFAKGILAMYALQNYIGEEKVNLALKKFIRDWNNSNGKLKSKTPNYPTTKELLTYFIEFTPVSLHHKVYPLFEKTKFDSNVIFRGK
ncbi:hypothetical protein [Flavobacterium sp. PL02]|jgi:ABC-2 type transport system permease protein|uniref:hypothetical protein n=1 Tax=Flavobacterium sp. PL02 TaxID=3088354 RepID=UPI002B2373B3|nr:hypothetical protein [Flavobacterium sp. PL02]MEA9412446.1 hypothetical protein [Flavobacterium sp. PL02]